MKYLSGTMAIAVVLSAATDGFARQNLDVATAAQQEYGASTQGADPHVAQPPPPDPSSPSSYQSLVGPIIEEPPSSGLGPLVAGIALTALGVVNLGTSPLCFSSLIDSSISEGCFVASMVLGGVFLAVGIPLLVVGGVKRRRFKDWQRQRAWMPAPGFGDSFQYGASGWLLAF